MAIESSSEGAQYLQKYIDQALDMKFPKATWDVSPSGAIASSAVDGCVMITASSGLVRSEPKPMSVRAYPLHKQYSDLHQARELVANGWVKNTLHTRMYERDGSYRDSYCAVGGLARSVLPQHYENIHHIFAIHSPGSYRDSQSQLYLAHRKVVTLRTRLENMLEQVEGHPRRNVPGWNDQASTTKAIVLQVFDATLDELLREMREESRRQERIRVAQEQAYQYLFAAFGVEDDDEEELLVPEEWVAPEEEQVHEREVFFA